MYIVHLKTTVGWGDNRPAAAALDSKKFPRNFENHGGPGKSRVPETRSHVLQEHEELLVDRPIVAEEDALVIGVVWIGVEVHEESSQEYARRLGFISIDAKISRTKG